MITSAVLSRAEGIRHGFFTRLGGVSGGIYASLNCGVGSKDEPDCVHENRARVLRRLGADPAAIATPYQVHSANVVVTERAWAPGEAPRADAVVTTRPGLAVGVLTADCAPVLLCDPTARVVAAVHAGWRGALAGVVEATVVAMQSLGADCERMRACVGPAISQAAYEVGPEFEQRFLAAGEENARYFRRSNGTSRAHFDLVAYIADRLTSAGVAEVETAGLCTYREEERFYSFRRATHRGEGDYGRQISAILLT